MQLLVKVAQRGLSHRPSLAFYSVGILLTKTCPASSKADIFEAKIASAVDEADSSDSGETFVYESNPPETSERPRRFHSRTPSATSMASQVDQRGNGRSIIHGVMESGHSVAMKRSMKFANSYNSAGPDTGTGEDDGKGTARSNVGTGRGTTHHHHIGRWGRNGGNSHPSLFDNESPFPNVAKSKFMGNGSRNSSQPSSPRGMISRVGNGKKTSLVPPGYDIDDGAGADDERTPLMGSTVRSARSGRYRRQPFSLRQLEHQASRQNPTFLNRFAGCLVLTIMVLLVISGAIGFMFATTQPLSGAKILELKNVLASEQEIMFDMVVSALNPNVIVITVNSVAIEVFAKSKYAGTDSEWWRRPQISNKIGTRDDSPHDPPLDPDDPNKTPLLKLGSISSFDNPLLFDGSPFEHKKSIASGELSLQKPGNKTEPGGSERWGRVLKYEFNLIVKGVLKYQLPMSQQVRSVAVDGRVLVKPANTKLRFTPELGVVVGHEEDEVHTVREIEVS
jgi:Vacuolar segregation subunit 7